jgi:tetratricopeptide (TPR) repeat protein
MNRLKIALVCILLLWLSPSLCRAESYALLIGIDKYPDAAHNLDGCVADIHGVADALKASGQYRPENIEVLAGEGKTKVTRQEILATVARMAARIQPDDTLFFFWSGHGAYIEGSDRVQPYDIDVSSPQAFTHSALSVQEMVTPLLRSRCKALLLFFNMCRGDADGRLGYLASPIVLPPTPKIEQATPGGPQQKVALYSSQEGQFSWMWPAKRRSFFGYYLEQGLRGAAADAKGEIRVENLISYIQKAVPGRCWREDAFRQNPYVVSSGPKALQLTLATGLPPGKGGTTAVPTLVGESTDDRFDAAFQAATEQWAQQHYEEARVKFEEAVKLKPEDIRAYVVLADVDTQLQRLDEAERYYRKAMEAWPKNDSLCTRLAAVFWFRKDYAEAEKLYRQAMKLNAKAPQPIYSLANLYANIQHDDARAIPLFIRAIALDPTDPAMQRNLGAAFLRQQKYDDAERIYRKVIELHPEDGDAIGSLAYLLYAVKKDISGAEKLYLRAVTLAPEAAWLHISLGRIYSVDKKNEAEAEKHFRRAMALEPGNDQPFLGLANMYYYSKKYDAAEALYRKVLDHTPRQTEALFQIGSIAYLRAQYAEAEKMYDKALEVDPKYTFAMAGLANIHYARKEFTEAEKLFRSAIAVDAAVSSFHVGLASCIMQQNRREDAMVEANKAIDLGATEEWLYTLVGRKPK